MPPDLRLIQPYTMMPAARLKALASLVQGCPGVLVQCGVYNGGSAALMAACMPADEVWLFDSFQGLPEPGPEDGGKAHRKFHEIPRGQWCRGNILAVREVFNLVSPEPPLHIISGWLQDTLSASGCPIPDVLHVDVDFYEATLLALQRFVPSMLPGALIIVDDYGHWRGAKLACDQFFNRPGQGFDDIPGDPTRYWFKECQWPRLGRSHECADGLLVPLS